MKDKAIRPPPDHKQGQNGPHGTPARARGPLSKAAEDAVNGGNTRPLVAALLLGVTESIEREEEAIALQHTYAEEVLTKGRADAEAMKQPGRLHSATRAATRAIRNASSMTARVTAARLKLLEMLTRPAPSGGTPILVGGDTSGGARAAFPRPIADLLPLNFDALPLEERRRALDEAATLLRSKRAAPEQGAPIETTAEPVDDDDDDGEE